MWLFQTTLVLIGLLGGSMQYRYHKETKLLIEPHVEIDNSLVSLTNVIHPDLTMAYTAAFNEELNKWESVIRPEYFISDEGKLELIPIPEETVEEVQDA